MSSNWQVRVTYAQNRGRTIERQADGLRQALVRAAQGDDGGEAGAASLKAIRTQLTLAEGLVEAWRAGRDE